MKRTILAALAACLLVGCQAHTSRGKWSPPMTDKEMEFLTLAAQQKNGEVIIDRYMAWRATIGIDIATASTDGFDEIRSSLTMAIDPVTLKPTAFTAARGSDISSRAADLTTAIGNAYSNGANATANLASKIGAGVATGGGSTLLDTLVGAAAAGAANGDTTILDTLTKRLEGVRKLAPPK